MRENWATHLGRNGLMLACAAGAIAWNASRFHGAKAQIYAKELTFFPTPVMAEMLSFGHRNSFAKLRWIDSFAYFEYQIDKKDDTVVVGEKKQTGPGGFQRLYDMLLVLDPQFRPFYDTATLCTAGILGQYHIALGYLMQGILNLPHEPGIWRNAAAILQLNYQLENRHPEQMNAFLNDWAAAMQPDEALVRSVWDWKASLAKRQYQGLEQLPYWLDRLKETKPDTATGDFIEGVIREQLARYGVVELDALMMLYMEAHAQAPANLAALIEKDLLKRRYGQKLPVHCPIARADQGLVLRSDPYGYAYILTDGRVISPGLERVFFERKLQAANYNLESHARKTGTLCMTLDDVMAAGIKLPDPPPGGSIVCDNGHLSVQFNEPPAQPWDVRLLER